VDDVAQDVATPFSRRSCSCRSWKRRCGRRSPLHARRPGASGHDERHRRARGSITADAAPGAWTGERLDDVRGIVATALRDGRIDVERDAVRHDGVGPLACRGRRDGAGRAVDGDLSAGRGASPLGAVSGQQRQPEAPASGCAGSRRHMMRTCREGNVPRAG
jgi:hypothetical protein